MKNEGKNGSTKRSKNAVKDVELVIHSHKEGYVRSLEKEVELHKREKDNLLALCNDLTAVRKRKDLTDFFSSSLQHIFHFPGAGIVLIDTEDKSCFHFVQFCESICNEYEINSPPALSTKYPLNNSFVKKFLEAPVPFIVTLKEVVNESTGPDFVHHLYESGVKTLLVSPLKNSPQLSGFVYVTSTQPDDFPEVFKYTMEAIAPHVTNAVHNIILNEEINARLSVFEKLLEGNDHPREPLNSIYDYPEIIGKGPAMQKVFRLMASVVKSDSTVLLSGETGAGKEVIARTIHGASPRKSKPMIKVNCATLPKNLIESELFGHEKGSFTGAFDRKVGKFELANQSTLFLDEIGEMPLAAQVKLLRVLQEKELERVGGKAMIKVDVRIIAATNQDLENEVRKGRFRADLYYRLNVFPISLPPLRDRQEDILPLANFFLDRYSKKQGKKVTTISAKSIEKLKNYYWPGNVRELEHIIERSVLLAEGSSLTEVEIPKQNKTGSTVAEKTLEQIEREYIIEALKKHKGQIAGKEGVAIVLGIPSTTLRSKMKKLGIRKTGK